MACGAVPLTIVLLVVERLPACGIKVFARPRIVVVALLPIDFDEIRWGFCLADDGKRQQKTEKSHHKPVKSFAETEGLSLSWHASIYWLNVGIDA